MYKGGGEQLQVRSGTIADQTNAPFGVKNTSRSSVSMYLSTAMRSWTFRSSYSLKLAMIGAERYIQFSEPQLEQDKFPEDETPKVRLASQFAQNTIRLSKARLT